MVITAGANELTLQAGQMYIHKPNEFHKIRCDGTQAANSVILSFDCECKLLMSVAGMVITCSADERRLIGCIISEATQAFSTPLGTPYTSVLEKSGAGEFACEQMIQLYLEQLLIRLIRSNKRVLPVKNAENNGLLLQICTFLENNLRRHMSFSDIQKEFGVSASVLKRLFHDNMGCGIMEHFSRLKIDAAKQLIREDELNFTQISEHLGFGTQQYFTTVFKRISGMTPSEYKNSVKLNFISH